jgi:hypothetical protein
MSDYLNLLDELSMWHGLGLPELSNLLNDEVVGSMVLVNLMGQLIKFLHLLLKVWRPLVKLSHGLDTGTQINLEHLQVLNDQDHQGVDCFLHV